jgi:hypothetical protein
MNIILLYKWWWKAENGEGIWQDIVRKKYKKKGMISLLAKNLKNSPVWNDLLKVRHVYLKGRSMKVGNGKNTSFWHNRWCGQQECSVEYMNLKNWRLFFQEMAA